MEDVEVHLLNHSLVKVEMNLNSSSNWLELDSKVVVGMNHTVEKDELVVVMEVGAN